MISTRNRQRPKQLFESGNVGLWIDPSDLGTQLTWRRNQILWSEDFRNIAWTKTRSSITAVSTYFKLVEDSTASNNHTLSCSPNNSIMGVGSFQTYTARLMAGERTRIAFQIDSNTSTVFDLSNGTIVATGSGVTASITSAGGGWYDCIVTKFITSNLVLSILLVNTGTTTSYNGDGSSGVYIQRVQYELGTTATEYQKITNLTQELNTAFPRATVLLSTTGTPVYKLGLGIGTILDKRGSWSTTLAPIDQFTVIAAGSGTNPTVNSATTYLSQNCVSAAWGTSISGGGFSVSRMESSTGAGKISTTAGQFHTIGYSIAISRALGSTESITVSPTGGNGTNAVTLDQTTPSGVWVDYAVGSNCVLSQTASTLYFAVFPVTTTSAVTVYVRQFTIQSHTGNNLWQATSTKRPLLSAKKNFINDTQSLTSATYWTKTNCATTLGQTDWESGSTGILVTSSSTAATSLIAIGMEAVTNSTVTVTVYAKTGGTFASPVFMLRNNSTATNFQAGTFDASTGAISGTGWASNSVGSGWYKLTFTQSTSISPGNLLYLYCGANGGSVTNGQTWYFARPQIESGSSSTAYQESVTSTNYTDIGVKRSLFFDGSDDFMQSAAFVTNTSDELSIHTSIMCDGNNFYNIVETSTASTITTGCFLLYVTTAATSTIELTGNIGGSPAGTYNSVVGNTASRLAPTVITYDGKISTDVGHLYYNTALSATGVTNGGTGTLNDTRVMYFGAKAGTSQFLKGYIYGLVIRNAVPTQSDRLSMDRWINGKAGAY